MSCTCETLEGHLTTIENLATNQNATIDAQNATIAALEARIAALEELLNGNIQVDITNAIKQAFGIA